MLHKGASTQRHNQQVLAKPHHNPSDRDQQAREKLQQKTKIKSRAYIQLGEETLQTVHRTFQPDIPVILHLPALSDGSLNSKSTSTPTLKFHNKYTPNNQMKLGSTRLCSPTGKYQY